MYQSTDYLLNIYSFYSDWSHLFVVNTGIFINYLFLFMNVLLQSISRAVRRPERTADHHHQLKKTTWDYRKQEGFSKSFHLVLFFAIAKSCIEWSRPAFLSKCDQHYADENSSYILSFVWKESQNRRILLLFTAWTPFDTVVNYWLILSSLFLVQFATSHIPCDKR